MEYSYRILLNPPPSDSQLAIVSINDLGTLGNLNGFVIKDFGYDPAILNLLKLEKGYDLFELNAKPILFVVTINQKRDTAALLRANLSKALSNNPEALFNRKIWIPLLGTGAGGLSYQESLQIIIDVLNVLKDFSTDHKAEFIIAIPNDSKGIAFHEEILKDTNSVKDDIIEKLIETSNSKFFLVGSSWDGEEQAERFYENNLWETGYHEKYIEIINRVKTGDILIHKSSFSTKDGNNYLRFKGLGVVTHNLNNGTTLNVNWIVKKQKIDVKKLGYHRSTIVQSQQGDVITIFNSLPDNLKKRIIVQLSSSNTISTSTQIAGLISDLESGKDYLNITPDVNSFALLLAAKSFAPPLAIALLGRWGSGKSFFMNKLKQKIIDLSDSASNHFCEGIVHVHFNAWSYMDANLWASITTRIFEGLHHYIKSDTLASGHIDEIEKRLTEDLSVIKEELAHLKNKKEEIDKQLEVLEVNQTNIKKVLDDKIKIVRENSLKSILTTVDKEFKVQEKIQSAINENESIVKNIDEFKKIVPEQYWYRPEEMYEKIRSVPTFIRLFTSSPNRRYNCIWLVVTLLLLVGIPSLIWWFRHEIGSNTFILTPGAWMTISFLGAIYVRAVKVYKDVSPFFAKMWRIKEDYLKQKNDAIFEFEQQQKALAYEIEYNKSELDSISTQITNVKIVQSTVVFKMENSLSTAALYEFIEKRCNSEDYKKHLGLVSIVRKDFEILSDLFTNHKGEYSKTKDKKRFRELFSKPLDRIILYVDDLDRCPEERVVEVLEAVNLLMAFPLFIVVVGVDPVWVKNALVTKYKKQFGYKDSGHEYIDPASYLEKIFQIPFHLKQAENNHIKDMLEGLSQVQELPNYTSENNNTSTDSEEKSVDTKEMESEAKSEAETIITTSEGAISESIVIKALSFSDDESACIREMSVIVGTSPRLIKRYINIYRIVKTHDYINSGSNINDEDLRIILFVLALSLGNFRAIMPSLIAFLELAKDEEQFSRYLGTKLEDDTNELRIELLNLLRRDLPDRLSYEAGQIKKHINFIRRFTL
ncbi:P-loop NTPase fold protein [Flavobacterium sp. FlaQc-30]|uniref:P-loop NTPase fold protein n=1 Tax=Flavobacterium sp. FlaQc-30 TaxID=3374179 RepID=UPI003756A20F